MPEPIDHKAEALRLLERASSTTSTTDELVAVAFVRSNLAIAEGQERVAEEIKLLRHQREEERNPWP